MGKRALNSGMYKIMSEDMQIYFYYFLKHSFQSTKNGVIDLR